MKCHYCALAIDTEVQPFVPLITPPAIVGRRWAHLGCVGNIAGVDIGYLASVALRGFGVTGNTSDGPSVQPEPAEVPSRSSSAGMYEVPERVEELCRHMNPVSLVAQNVIGIDEALLWVMGNYADLISQKKEMITQSAYFKSILEQLFHLRKAKAAEKGEVWDQIVGDARLVWSSGSTSYGYDKQGIDAVVSRIEALSQEVSQNEGEIAQSYARELTQIVEYIVSCRVSRGTSGHLEVRV